MTGKTIEERIEALNPDTVNWNDANAYAAMGIGEADDSDGEGTGQTNEGDTTAAATTTTAPAAAPAAAPAVAAPAPATSSTAPAAPAPSDRNEAVEGIATRDGKSVIPYAVLQATRRDLRESNARLAQAEAALAEASKKVGATGSELADRATEDPDSLSDEDMAALEQDFPSLVKPLKILRAASAQVQRLTAAPSPAPVAAPAPAVDPHAGQSEEEAFDAGIAANPLLASWMGSNGKEWQRAQAVDRLLMQDPDNQGLSYADRFAKVQRMVAAEFGHQVPAAAAPTPANAPAAPAAAPLPAAKPAAMPSLSDLGGTAPRSDEDAINGQTNTDLLAAAERMTDAQLMRMAGLSY